MGVHVSAIRAEKRRASTVAVSADSWARNRGIACVESNRDAVAKAVAWATGELPFLALSGAAGWGKTFLACEAAELAMDLGCSVQVRCSSQASLGSEMLVLDVCSSLRPRTRSATELAALLERRVRAQLSTLLVVGSECGCGRLPRPSRWARAQILEPSDAERVAIAGAICRRLGFFLSEASQAQVVRMVGGDGHRLFGGLQRLALHVERGTPIDNRPVRIAGLLHPHAIGVNGRDVRDIVTNAAGQTRTRGILPALQPNERTIALAAYVLSKEALLCEALIGEYFGIPQSCVYGMIQHIREYVDEGDCRVRRCLERIRALAGRELSEDAGKTT
jgi:hypothetical protein